MDQSDHKRAAQTHRRPDEKEITDARRQGGVGSVGNEGWTAEEWQSSKEGGGNITAKERKDLEGYLFRRGQVHGRDGDVSEVGKTL